jgi:hypothetical protein
MLQYPFNMGLPDCRRLVVPSCEPDIDPTQSAPLMCLTAAPLQMKLRDTIDFTVDFTDWLAANGSPTLATATWAVAAASPKTPTILSSSHSPFGKTNIVITPGVNALAGDTYFLEVTVVTTATAPVLPTDLTIAARTLVRQMRVIVVNG